LTGEEWKKRSASWSPVTVEGLEPCLSLLGIDLPTPVG
jgi:hypothetical protein